MKTSYMDKINVFFMIFIIIILIATFILALSGVYKILHNVKADTVKHEIHINGVLTTMFSQVRCVTHADYDNNTYKLECPDKNISTKFINIRENDGDVYITK